MRIVVERSPIWENVIETGVEEQLAANSTCQPPKARWGSSSLRVAFSDRSQVTRSILAAGINTAGAIVGLWVDAANNIHSFLFRSSAGDHRARDVGEGKGLAGCQQPGVLFPMPREEASAGSRTIVSPLVAKWQPKSDATLGLLGMMGSRLHNTSVSPTSLCLSWPPVTLVSRVRIW